MPGVSSEPTDSIVDAPRQTYEAKSGQVQKPNGRLESVMCGTAKLLTERDGRPAEPTDLREDLLLRSSASPGMCDGA